MFRGRRSKGLWDLTRLCGRCSKSSSVKCHDSDWKKSRLHKPPDPTQTRRFKSLFIGPGSSTEDGRVSKRGRC